MNRSYKHYEKGFESWGQLQNSSNSSFQRLNSKRRWSSCLDRKLFQNHEGFQRRKNWKLKGGSCSYDGEFGHNNSKKFISSGQGKK